MSHLSTSRERGPQAYLARLLRRFRAALATRPIALACLVLLVGFVVSDRASVIVTETLEHRAHREMVTEIRTFLTDLETHLLDEARRLSGLADLQSAIVARDFARLFELTQDEVRRGAAGMILVTDADGIALSRTRSIGHRGDYVFDRTAWGRALGDGQEIATIDRGVTHPLVLIAGVPVTSGVERIGAVLPAYRLDDDFARMIRDRIGIAGAEVAFAVRDIGLVGHSFAKEKEQLAEIFLNPAQLREIEAVTEAHPDAMWDIGVGKEGYSVVYVAFPGFRESPGGMFIFTPTCHTCWASGVAAFFALFVAGFGVLAFRFVGLSVPRSREGVFVLLGLGILGAGAMYMLSLARMEGGVLRISEPHFAIYNSTIEFEPDTDIVDPSFEQRVAIRVKTGGETINAVEAVVGYDPDSVSVEEILTADSFCDPGFFMEKTIDDIRGEVRIACGVPNPAFSEPEGIVAQIVLRPRHAGSYTLRFLDETQVLANDGLGTDVLRQSTDATYQVLDRQASTTIPRGAIFSYTHPNSSRWYRARAAHFSWPHEAGHTYRYALDRSVVTVPRDGAQTDASSVALFVPEDGEYFFHLLDRIPGDGERVSHFQIRVDATPPPPPTIAVSNENPRVGETVRFEFTSREPQEGLRRGFYLRIGERGMFIPIENSFVVPFLRSGAYPITVRSFDQAGNWSDATKTIRVSP